MKMCNVVLLIVCSLLCIAAKEQSIPNPVSNWYYAPIQTSSRLPSTSTCANTPKACNTSAPTCCAVGGDYWCGPYSVVCCGCVPYGPCFMCNQGDKCISAAVCSSQTGYIAGIAIICAIIVLVVIGVITCVCCCLGNVLCCCL